MMTTKKDAVRMERVIPAPPHDVYRAWLDPNLLRRWMTPGVSVKKIEVDERVGGKFRIWHADGDRDAGGFECEIVELVPSERIVFRWGFVGPQRTAGPVFDSRLTITLRAAPKGGTALALVHEQLDELAAALPHVADKVGAGWEVVLEKLASIVGVQSNPSKGKDDANA